jgi:alkylation response protein AidB-like acyl-CoA dehydrogenase
MNTARISTAVQGLAASEGAFQGALTYAKDRLAMRSLTGPKAPEKEADPIIVHPAVRNMLLTQKHLLKVVVHWFTYCLYMRTWLKRCNGRRA